MRKAIILLLAVFLLAVAFELPDSITGFFMGIATSIWDIFKEILKSILLTIANML